MGESSYVVAGMDTYASLLQRFMEGYPGFIESDNLANFMKNSVNKFLFSYGTGLTKKSQKISKNHSQKMTSMIQKVMGYSFMKKSKLFIDSGGYQISVGAIPSPKIPSFIDMYYQWLEDNVNEYTHAFILDIPPGPGTDTFTSYEDVYNLNKTSYKKAQELSPEVKKKIIYIHHFRTPQIYQIWEQLLNEGYGDGYEYYSTGGLVAYGSSDNIVPAILYSIPLSALLVYAKKHKLKTFKFHILGGANFRDVFYHQLFAYHIKQVHDIDLDITYDSSAIFKGVFNARTIHVLRDDGRLSKMDLRSASMHLRWEDGISIEQKLYELLNHVATIANNKKLTPDEVPIYNSETGTFSKHIYMYLMLYVLQLYKDQEELSKKRAKEIYHLYRDGKINEFDAAVSYTTKMINQGKLTRKQKSKSVSVYNTMKILENLDLEYCKHFVGKYTSSDDSSKMFDGGMIQF